MIDEHLEEQASLYVLCVLTPEERGSFEAALGRDAELRQLVESLRGSRDALAGSLPLVTPPPSLKNKILEQIESREKVVTFPSQSGNSGVRTSRFPGGWLPWAPLPWALAAFLTIACGISLMQQKSLRHTNAELASHVSDLSQMADSLRTESQSLKQAVVAISLREAQLQDVRIAVLDSTQADAPKAVAVSLWDDKKQSGVFVAQNLKPLPKDRDYQLWVIDPKYSVPVSAGVFQVDAQGNVRIAFKADKPIEIANKFAVTEEPKGGLPTPTLKNLVLIGG